MSGWFGMGPSGQKRPSSNGNFVQGQGWSQGADGQWTAPGPFGTRVPAAAPPWAPQTAPSGAPRGQQLSPQDWATQAQQQQADYHLPGPMEFTSAPGAPDYYGAASAQAQAQGANLAAQTQANRPNINTPFGSQSWTKDANGNWTMSQGLSGDVQKAFSQLKPFDLGAFGSQPQFGAQPQFGNVGNGEQARNQAIDAAYGQSMARLNPQMRQSSQALDAKLANQGLGTNSAAARSARAQMAAQQNDAQQGALNSAIMQGTAAGDSIFRNNLAGEQARFGAGLAGQQAKFGADTMGYQNAIANALRTRGLPIQDMQQLLPFMATPDFAKAGMAQAPDYMGATAATGNYNLGAWNAQNQANADTMQGFTNLMGAFVPFGF